MLGADATIKRNLTSYWSCQIVFLMSRLSCLVRYYCRDLQARNIIDYHGSPPQTNGFATVAIGASVHFFDLSE